jgi:hypothetical protein
LSNIILKPGKLETVTKQRFKYILILNTKKFLKNISIEETGFNHPTTALRPTAKSRRASCRAFDTRKNNEMSNLKPQKKKRKSGIPTGNAGEYFVMGELLRRGFDAQLADRNTKDYDILVGLPTDKVLKKLQVKTVRSAPWYVKTASYSGELANQLTIFVLLGDEKAQKQVRYFITRNSDVASQVHHPQNWKNNGFMPLNGLKEYEDRWNIFAE